MCKKVQNYLTIMILVIAMVGTLAQTVSAASVQTDAAAEAANSALFTNLSELHVNESMERTISDANGDMVLVGIEKVKEHTYQEKSAVASGETWRVWYSSFAISAEFYMTVSNNKVTSVYDQWISITGGTHSNANLTKTSTYGKLSFDVTGIAGLISGTCWLKGTVTGEDDQIEVTWQM